MDGPKHGPKGAGVAYRRSTEASDGGDDVYWWIFEVI